MKPKSLEEKQFIKKKIPEKPQTCVSQISCRRKIFSDHVYILEMLSKRNLSRQLLAVHWEFFSTYEEFS